MDADKADAVVRILGLAVNFSNPVQLAALIIICVFLIALIWFWTRVGSASHDIDRLKTATASNNVEVVTQIAGRYGVNLDTLTADQKFLFAMEQVKGAKLKFLILTAAGLVTLIAVLIFFVIAATPAKAVDEDPTKFFLVLAEVADPELRIKIYKQKCACEPPAEYIELLRIMAVRDTGSPAAADPATKQVVKAVSNATSREEIDSALAGYDAVTCNGKFDFSIRDGILYCSNGRPIPFIEIKQRGGKLEALKAIVFHFTGGGTFQTVIAMLKNPHSPVVGSFHLLISRTGAVVQFASLEDQTWHAGSGEWNGLSGLNKYSIGISYDNVGQLRGDESAGYSFGRQSIDRKDVVCYGADGGKNCWQGYTPAQLAVTRDLVKAIYAKYGKVPLLGHSDIAPGRKTDPGPAFPLDELRKAVGSPATS